MSGANSWLQRQRKTDLTELAQHTGLKNYESLKKPELELALDEYLAENSNTFSSDPKLANYYSSRARTAGSPFKRDAVDSTVDRIRVTKRRATKSIEEFVPPPDRIPLPATPADVVEVVDRSTVAVRTHVVSLYKESGITEATYAARESLSTVTSVLFAISVFELYFLRPEILADRYAFTIPAVSFLGTKDFPVFVPDMFLLLTSSFWSPALLWAFTSTFVPSIAGYFINLTVSTHHGRYRRSNSPDNVVDPLTFSIAKALISYVVYAQGITFGGWIDDTSIARINSAIFGGYKGILTGTAITGIFSFYDAVLKK
ncbi:hypothetical protein M426DRAFT_20493 [Hypoxylon sp. CI-4A]|nr:hypothetical protein M426DRAFT_20493 [Hypoxylon sp. CI-4A]